MALGETMIKRKLAMKPPLLIHLHQDTIYSQIVALLQATRAVVIKDHEDIEIVGLGEVNSQGLVPISIRKTRSKARTEVSKQAIG